MKKIKPLLLSSFSKAINAYLFSDPESVHRLQKLKGKLIHIELLPLQFNFECQFDVSGITLDAYCHDNPDVVIRGTPLQMVGVTIAKEKRQQFFAEEISIEGDAEVAEAVIHLFDHMEIDWEEKLSHLIGNVGAHYAGELLRSFKTWAHHAEESMVSNINEYVHEEANYLPCQEALNDFYNDIDHLRMDVDRLEAKLNQLISKFEEAE